MIQHRTNLLSHLYKVVLLAAVLNEAEMNFTYWH